MLNPKPRKPASPSKPSRAAKGFKEELLLLFRDAKASLTGWIKQWDQFRDIVKNNYELGRHHLALGNLKDAILRFRFVLWLNPNHADAMYHLGASYMASGNKKSAADYFKKALMLRPGYEEAAYLLAVVGGRGVPAEAMPKSMPLTLAREYFDSLAAGYDAAQLQRQYEGHVQLVNALRACLTPGRMDHLMLELGVGTGLCGAGLRDAAAHLTGVDISSEMLAEAVKREDARGAKMYDALIRREAVEFLKDSPEKSYDVILSAGMFGAMGDVRPVFEEAARILKDKGIFAFTADKGEGEGYRFEPARTRFAFSRAYLQDLAQKYGFKELKCKDAPVYPDEAAWVCVYQKG